MTRRGRRSRRPLLFAAVAVLCAADGSLADERCAYPPPVFHCEDWRRDEDGLFIAKKSLMAGLMPIDKDHYIGGGIRVAGFDYGDLLRRQCAPGSTVLEAVVGDR